MLNLITIKFTLEISVKLPFSDTEIQILLNTLQTNFNINPTYTNLLMQYKSVCPKAWKFGPLCKSFVDFKEEI